MNAWRKELSGLLARAGTARPAALRRSLREEFLYATDLPVIDGQAAAAFAAEAEKAGWTVGEDGGWMQLDRTAGGRPEGAYGGPFGPEAGCCASLLERHPERGTADRAAEHRLVKAGEEGFAAYEKACGEIHREWAARLRKGQLLPDLSELFFREE